ncbi:MAG: basic amino acid/polyamine antiporter [Sarcina sp.]
MEKKVGLIGLIAMVVGSMIGGGVFELPAEMAKSGRPFSAIIAWFITGLGMFFVGKVFQTLSDLKPNLKDGIYTYSKVGFGKYIGFNSAWGYWLSHILGNTSYIVLFIFALHSFFPQMGGIGSVTSIIISIVMIWGILFIIAKSMAMANKLNTIATIGKVLPVIFAIILLFLCFKLKVFTTDFYGIKEFATGGTTASSVFSQVKHGLLATVWTFTGIEGAVVISGRAKNIKDVGKATIVGYIFTLICYVLIVMLSFGALSQGTLEGLQSPALAGVLGDTYGIFGRVMINIGVIISVLGAWVAWTIITAEVPMTVAKDAVFPRFLGKKLKSGAAINSLIVNAIIMQIAFFLSMFASNAFSQITSLATMMVLMPYIFSALYLIKLAIQNKKVSHFIYGAIAVIFCVYALTTAGLDGLSKIFIFYALGIIYMVIVSIENKKKMFDKKWEMYLCIVISIIGILSLIYSFT